MGDSARAFDRESRFVTVNGLRLHYLVAAPDPERLRSTLASFAAEVTA